MPMHINIKNVKKFLAEKSAEEVMQDIDRDPNLITGYDAAIAVINGLTDENKELRNLLKNALKLEHDGRIIPCHAHDFGNHVVANSCSEIKNGFITLCGNQ